MKTAGIDGCPAGWMAIDFDESNPRYWVIRETDELDDVFGEYDRIFIDIPIGVNDVEYVRECDEILRRELGPDYKASVFNPPIRSALYAPTYAEACMQSYSANEKKVSIQAWNITPKIREVDQLLQKNEEYRDKIFESHPELLFKRLNGGGSILQKKQTTKGLKHRLELIKKQKPVATDFYRNIKEEFRRNEVAEDDIVDAMVLAFFADKSVNDEIKKLPEDPEKDSEGLPMAIHYV